MGRIGNLRNRIAIQLANRKTNEDGQEVPQWDKNLVSNLPAEVYVGSGRKATRAQGEQEAVGDAVVTIRYRGDINPNDMRVMYGNTPLNIVAVESGSGLKLYEDLICKYDA